MVDTPVAYLDSMPIDVVLVGSRVAESVVDVDCMAGEDRVHDAEGYMVHRAVLHVLDAWESLADHHHSSLS